jgi:hypothetical protein
MYARCSGYALGFLLAAAVVTGPAWAQQAVTKLGEFHDWTAYVAGQDAGRICYVVGEPANPATADGRAPRYAYVSHRPARKAWSVVMIYPGAPYKPATEATIAIGKSRFALFTYRDTAWNEDADADARLVKAMRVGRTMTVHGTDSEGNSIVDQYSLTGFLAAYRRIGEACNLK